MDKNRAPGAALKRGRKRPLTAREILEDGTLIDEAMTRAAREALLLHKRMGISVPVWRNGRIVRIKPQDIKLPVIRRQASRRRRATR
jgi:hypothetical protein